MLCFSTIYFFQYYLTEQPEENVIIAGKKTRKLSRYKVWDNFCLEVFHYLCVKTFDLFYHHCYQIKVNLHFRESTGRKSDIVLIISLGSRHCTEINFKGSSSSILKFIL